MDLCHLYLQVQVDHYLQQQHYLFSHAYPLSDILENICELIARTITSYLIVPSSEKYG